MTPDWWVVTLATSPTYRPGRQVGPYATEQQAARAMAAMGGRGAGLDVVHGTQLPR